jgi:hypothetical protein
MELASPRRFQFSVRTLLVVTAVLAFSLTPVGWVARERQRMRLMQDEMLRAREEAIRSVLLAERRRVALHAKRVDDGPTSGVREGDEETAKAPAVTPEILIEHLRKENHELKDTVDSLRLEVRRLRAAGGGR